MRLLGLIGGMSWESTELYYRAINTAVQRELGGHHSARLLLSSVDFEGIERLQRAGDWQQAADQLAGEARRLAAAGADCIVLCTNTMHKVADSIEAATTLPLLHIVDATAGELLTRGIATIGLLGTRFTMEEDFYRERLAQRCHANVIVPSIDERAEVDRIIFKELCHGAVIEKSRQRYLEVIDRLAAAGADAVILGCTEIGMLVQASHTAVPLIDSTAIHAKAIVRFALDG